MKARHVVRSGKSWVVKAPRRPSPISRHRTQQAAYKAAARSLRRAGGGEVRTHGLNNRIRSSNTIGKRDPFSPRG